MGATSVTGKGPGNADSGIKGPGNNRNYFVPQINPHVAAAGRATTNSSTALVTFPSPLAGGYSEHVILLTAVGTATSAQVSARTNDSDGNFESFEITCASSTEVMWAVMTTGWGLDVTA
jgi:hypothetical protein